MPPRAPNDRCRLPCAGPCAGVCAVAACVLMSTVIAAAFAQAAAATPGAAQVAATGATAKRSSLPDSGRALIEQYQCGTCHRIPGVRGGRGNFGPTLEHFGRRVYISGRIPVTPESLQRWIQDPRELIADTRMPALGVPAPSAQAMAAYLLSLR